MNGNRMLEGKYDTGKGSKKGKRVSGKGRCGGKGKRKLAMTYSRMQLPAYYHRRWRA